MNIKRVYIETLGCNKNVVDSEIITTLLKERGIEIIDNPEEADDLIVNTCGFIDDAKAESINTILTLAQYKKKSKNKSTRLFVTGCFSQLYYKEIVNEMPEVDGIFGVGDFVHLVNVVSTYKNENEEKTINGSLEVSDKRVYNNSFKIFPKYLEYNIGKRYLTTNGFAYVKIAEGCSRNCSFCLIPKIRGQFRSRKIESIVDEIKALEEEGIHEAILVSQDTMSYGTDIGISNGLYKLIEKILIKTDINWVRLLYLRPTKQILNLLKLFKNTRLIPYFDIPIQHSSNKILRLMNREGSDKEYLKIIQEIRENIPEAVIRTSVITGFPGETIEDYENLKNFIIKAKFNHLGIFIYSPQEGTEAFNLSGKVPKKVAKKRADELYSIQSEISAKALEEEVGKVFEVLIEEKVEDEDIYFGRSYHFAPEVDGVFVVNSHKKIKVPALVKCQVKRAETYDLHGYVL